METTQLADAFSYSIHTSVLPKHMKAGQGRNQGFRTNLGCFLDHSEDELWDEIKTEIFVGSPDSDSHHKRIGKISSTLIRVEEMTNLGFYPGRAFDASCTEDIFTALYGGKVLLDSIESFSQDFPFKEDIGYPGHINVLIIFGIEIQPEFHKSGVTLAAIRLLLSHLMSPELVVIDLSGLGRKKPNLSESSYYKKLRFVPFDGKYKHLLALAPRVWRLPSIKSLIPSIS